MYNSCVRLPRLVLGLTCLLSLVSAPVPAQTLADSDHVAALAAKPTQVPPLIHFSNVANDESGAPLAGRVDITFSLYASQRGGDPLWSETQHVDLDAVGRYSVELGATKPQGVPPALFSSGAARWLGVQIGEQSQQPRVLLVSVPYALKAADAQTLGGLPAAAFLRVPGFESGSSNSTPASASSSAGVPPPLSGSGTANFVPLWTPDGNTLGSSLLFQNGSGSTGKIGIGNTNPVAKLDVSGAAIVRGALKLPSAGSATAATGKNSQTLNLVASSFNSTSNTASNEAFVWQAEPINNNTSNPLATLNLLFGSGTATPTETGVQFTALGSLQITKGGTGLVVTNSDTTNGAAATTIVGQATGTGSLTTASGVGGSAAGDRGTGVSGFASGISGHGVQATAIGASGIGLLATANGIAGIGIQAQALNGGGAGVFSNASAANATVTVGNSSATGSILEGLSAGGQILDIGPSAIFFTANARTTTIGNVGCDAGFVGISFGATLGCSDYSVVGEGTNTILNRRSGGRIDFRESNNTQMAIAAGGKVGIGTVTPAVLFDVLATNAGTHAPISQFGSAGTTDSNSVRTYNGTGATEVFAVGKVSNFVPGSAVGDGGLRVSPGHAILFGDSGLSRMTIDSSGNVHIAGNLSKGGGSFQIDHPLDPMNKYLYHSFVESPDMMNVYNGNIVTDKHGMATVPLPDYFDALNRDFRYQLTVIGQFAQAIVAHEIDKNHFVIKTSKPGVKVSWQVTGIRRDAYANSHRIPVEQEKPEAERGRYLHPDAFGVSQDQNAEAVPSQAEQTNSALSSRR